MGYHPGFEDDGIYLSAVKLQLNPTLYPHDSEFIRLQMQATVFDDLIAQSVHWTKLPVVWSELLWQFAALFLILWASRQIAARLFRQVHAQWSGVAMVAAMLTLPVAGTALNIAQPGDGIDPLRNFLCVQRGKPSLDCRASACSCVCHPSHHGRVRHFVLPISVACLASG